jgi:hypothetical protein
MKNKTPMEKKALGQSGNNNETVQEDPRRMSSSPQVPSKRYGERDSFGWLAEVRDALSPYWAARLEFQPESQGRVLVVQGLRQPTPPRSLRMVWSQK